MDLLKNNEFKETLYNPTKSSQNEKTILKFLTCGSVDDGKSTLIGRMLYETGSIFENELENLAKDTQRFGTTGESLDYALLVDGLSSEREQGITIDVAYRFFSTPKRKFIVADTPGHEQYTRNMATGASVSDCAIIMIDARKGVLPQTKRHSFIVSTLGIKHIIVAINKIDLIDYEQSRIANIEYDFMDFAESLDFSDISFIPVSALSGDNIASLSSKTPWYTGPSLIEKLEILEINTEHNNSKDNFRFPVQWVNRPNLNFRGYSGTIVSGVVEIGDSIKTLPSGKCSTIEKIVSFDGELKKAQQGDAVTLTLEGEIDISRGDVICSQTSPSEIADQFQATIIWMDEKPMVLSRQYIFRLGPQTAVATPTRVKEGININNLSSQSTKQLQLNECGVIELSLNKDIAFESYKNNKSLGGFILIDRLSNHTVACGTIRFALRRSGNIHKQYFEVGRKERSEIKGHGACVLWLTGLSGAGKSTIANQVERLLNAKGIHTNILDGDNVRHGLNKDLGFTEQARAENIRRVAEVSRLMLDAGLVTIVSFISPFESERQMAKELIGEKDFIEVHVDVPIDIAEKRDVKGLYKKARAGEIKNFTGIDSPYEQPKQPTLRIDTSELSSEQAANAILAVLKDRGIILDI